MESIWMDWEIPAFPPLRGDLKTDVLVIGGGMAGILCAHHLKAAGVDCAVVEATRIGSGITKNTTAKITAQHGPIYHKLLKRFGPEKTIGYLQANLDAVAQFQELCRGIDCDFKGKDSFVYSRSDRSILETEASALDSMGYPAELVEKVPLPFSTVGAVKFQNQAQFHPRKFLAAIARDLTIYENTPVRQLAKNTAITDNGNIKADAIIIATHFPMLNKHGSYFLKLYQDRSYVLALENAPVPEGMFRDGSEKGLSFRSFGDQLLLGGGGHRTGKQGGNWVELEQFTAQHYPGAAVTRRWATQDCMTLDGIPYIGPYSARTEGLYVATGFNKWGMTSSMAAATLLTDLVQGKENPYEEVFSPSRSILHKQLAVNTMESTVNLLTPSRPRCPHMGCALKWNRQEHSWDCPCHGSRFREDGTLIDNPATGDLKKRE